jgi:hypothetical protein
MNTSYSKIRHIQEANLKLEKRLLSEQDDNDLSMLKQKHGIKFRNDFEGDDDEFMDYLYQNRNSFDSFDKEHKERTKQPSNDDVERLKQKHGIKFYDDFEGDDDEFIDYLYQNRDSFNSFNDELKQLK